MGLRNVDVVSGVVRVRPQRYIRRLLHDIVDELRALSVHVGIAIGEIAHLRIVAHLLLLFLAFTLIVSQLARAIPTLHRVIHSVHVAELQVDNLASMLVVDRRAESRHAYRDLFRSRVDEFLPR